MGWLTVARGARGRQAARLNATLEREAHRLGPDADTGHWAPFPQRAAQALVALADQTVAHDLDPHGAMVQGNPEQEVTFTSPYGRQHHSNPTQSETTSASAPSQHHRPPNRRLIPRLVRNAISGDGDTTSTDADGARAGSGSGAEVLDPDVAGPHTDERDRGYHPGLVAVNARPQLDLVDLVARDYDATIGFYRRLGVNVDDGPPGDIRHAHIEFEGVEMHIDNEHLAALYNSSWRSGEQTRVVLGFRVPTREDVDATYVDMTGAGYVGVQCPYDTFWGARYAIVADPDGNHVGIMSPSVASRRYGPPQPAPHADD